MKFSKFSIDFWFLFLSHFEYNLMCAEKIALINVKLNMRLCYITE